MQKSAMPNFDQLLVPPFESEAKRISAAAKAAKPQQNVSIVEAGTSVAPRSRPKGSSSVHGQNALGLGLPPSPLPRQNITSPQPQAVVEQFQANFPAMPAVAPAPAPAATAPPPAPTVPATATAAATGVAPAAANNLFESSVYPDPFNEAAIGVAPVAAAGTAPTAAAIAAATTTAGTAVASDATSELPDTSLNELGVAGSIGTPTKHMLTPPKSSGAGHRRNVSDTSAFNK